MSIKSERFSWKNCKVIKTSREMTDALLPFLNVKNPVVEHIKFAKFGPGCLKQTLLCE